MVECPWWDPNWYSQVAREMGLIEDEAEEGELEDEEEEDVPPSYQYETPSGRVQVIDISGTMTPLQLSPPSTPPRSELQEESTRPRTKLRQPIKKRRCSSTGATRVEANPAKSEPSAMNSDSGFGQLPSVPEVCETCQEAQEEIESIATGATSLDEAVAGFLRYIAKRVKPYGTY